MDKDLIGKLLVIAVAVGVVVVGQTVATGSAGILNPVAGVLFGWVIPWFAPKGAS